MSDTTVSSNGGIGFFGLLGILFIGLKLTGFIDWSWAWVLAPIWIPIVLVIGILMIMGFVLLILWIINNIIK